MSARAYVKLEELVRLEFEARDFSLLPRQPVHSLLSGRHASRLRGRGLAFEELRRYLPGDDIRSIDWRATARRRRTQVRVYTEERDRPVLLVVDQRTGMFFGSQRCTKAVAAAEVAALAGWRALGVGDRVGAIVFGDEDYAEIKPHRSRGSLLRICQALVDYNARLSAKSRGGGGELMNVAFRRAAQMAKHDHLVVLVTDYDGDDDTTGELALRLASSNDVLAVLVYDPLGIRFNPQPGMLVSDGYAHLEVPTGATFQQRFEAAFSDRCEQLRERLRSVRIPIVPICTHEPVVDQVLAAVGRR